LLIDAGPYHARLRPLVEASRDWQRIDKAGDITLYRRTRSPVGFSGEGSRAGGPSGPQTGQSGRRRIEALRKVMSRRSNINNCPRSGSPRPASTLIASIAPSEATVPATVPKTG